MRMTVSMAAKNTATQIANIIKKVSRPVRGGCPDGMEVSTGTAAASVSAFSPDEFMMLEFSLIANLGCILGCSNSKLGVKFWVSGCLCRVECEEKIAMLTLEQTKPRLIHLRQDRKGVGPKPAECPLNFPPPASVPLLVMQHILQYLPGRKRKLCRTSLIYLVTPTRFAFSLLAVWKSECELRRVR